MKYTWMDMKQFEFLGLKKINLSFKVLNNEIYSDRDYPYKKNFKQPWNDWQGVEVEYLFNDSSIVLGYRGKTVWYIPVLTDSLANLLKIDKGRALKIIKYPVHDGVKEEYERLIKELTIQKILAKNNLAPDIFDIILVSNDTPNNVEWFGETYYHSEGSIYFACIVEHIKNDGLPIDKVVLDSEFFYEGSLVEEFKKECLKLRISPYDLGLGNLFYNEKTQKLSVIDVHKWTRTYEIKQVNVPKYLQIELNNTCNGRCIMCNIPNMNREKGNMSDELFIKIIKEANELNISNITPFLHGEPLMRKDFVHKLRLINTYAPNANIVIFTNASLMTRQFIHELKEIKNISEIVFSFPGGNKEVYEKVTGLDFEQTSANIQYAYDNLNCNKRISMPKCIENRDSEDNFFKLWNNHNASSYDTYNYIGNVNNTLSEITYEQCDRVIRSMTVLYDGRICLCCMDSEGEYIFGDLKEHTIYESWNSLKATEFRHKHSVSRLYCNPCSQCTQNLLVEEYKNYVEI